jgi:hypothetical protein
MFILYAIPVGIVLGYLMGGRLEGLAALRFRWAWLAIGGLLAQVVLFSPLVGDVVAGGLGEILYVVSTATVLVAVLRNIGIPGLVLVALGAISNLAAVAANGGIMPTTLAALESAGLAAQPGFSNSAVLDDPALAPLTDVYALPSWVPFANVFSVGDVLIGLGIVIVIAFGMRRRGA